MDSCLIFLGVVFQLGFTELFKCFFELIERKDSPYFSGYFIHHFQVDDSGMEWRSNHYLCLSFRNILMSYFQISQSKMQIKTQEMYNAEDESQKISISSSFAFQLYFFLMPLLWIPLISKIFAHSTIPALLFKYKWHQIQEIFRPDSTLVGYSYSSVLYSSLYSNKIK